MTKISKLFLFLIIFLAVFSAASSVYACNDRAYKNCVGNLSYWYDSCENRQDLYQNCQSYNLFCQFGQCVLNPEKPIVDPVVNPTYIPYSTKACYKGSVYWYDSLGAISGLYQNCIDSNSCTQDSCQNAKCSNVQKCDGSTCKSDSEDYNKYCLAKNCPNGVCDQSLGENENNCPVDCKSNNNTETKAENLLVSFFVKKDLASLQWDKTVQLGQNGIIYFMIVVNNNSNFQADSLVVSANIPTEISYLGNLKIDDVLVSGDIISGINIGSVQAQNKKTITFEGKTQTFNTKEDKQAVAFLNSNQISQSDFISINLDANQSNLASVSSEVKSNVIWEFIKRWYMWIAAGLVLIFLFIVVFRRVSKNV